ncbi:translation initiation factor IF-2 [Pseudochelatococcus contaminans]|uniref:Translation initiation factor IF-2 n=1 Tax=Pseudochelatococcus contaminans TaxID=1538103 RepID=A0A7W6EG03_9HYPH|nr:translation initiation factor IF-2 [Pseudochelatococcus contaminans]MBB3809105.1 translation initiation factor IF-2 [Pseudochelatococcus contaminans]
MSDTKNPNDKTLSVTPTKTLTLKRPVEQGVVRQSFSHGRTKAVVVEKVKRRVIASSAEVKEAPAKDVAKEAAPAQTASPAPAPAARAPAAPAPAAPAAKAPAPVEAAKSPAIAPEASAAAEVKAAPAVVNTPAPEKVVAEQPSETAAKTTAATAEVAVDSKPAATPAPAVSAAETPAAVAPKRSAPARETAAEAPAISQSRQNTRTPPAPPPARTPPAPQGRQPAAGRGGPNRGGNRQGSQRGGSGVVLRTLTDDERDARIQALTEARKREEEDRRRAIEEAKLRVEREAREKVEREAAEARKREEDERRRQEDEIKRRSEEEARRRLGAEGGSAAPAARTDRPQQARPASATPGAAAPRRPAGAATPGTAAPAGRPRAAEAEDDSPRTARRPGVRAALPPAPKPAKGVGDERRRGRLTVSAATSGDDGERTHSVAAYRRRQQRMRGQQVQEPKEKISREVIIPETITIQELALRMAERGVDVIRLLMKQGEMHKITDVIDADTAQLLAEELGHTVKRVAEADVEEGLFDTTPENPEDLAPRPPVVTIMGHVDHGKTSLLDAIRNANVVSGEAGGITQHIGAYQVKSPLGGKITFIDTPGHAAFTAMRARGAKVTDIVVLVVAADDGVMPQTIEAINHATAAQVPLIVAINKIDKPDANPQRVRNELLQHSVVVESMGGETLEFEVSAKVGTNLDKLLEGLQLQSEILELKANPEHSAEGTVIEAKLDRGRGPVATVLVQKGTLRVGDIVVAGAEWGRVRALIADTGGQIREAGPSVPAEVLGFNGTPEAGDRVAVVESEARAREITGYRIRQKRDLAAVRGAGASRSLADMMRDLKEGAGRKEFALVVKADVQGSSEAIVGMLEKAGNEEVSARIIHSGVGGITESDITLAEASGAVVIGFNVRANKEAREAAERAGVEIRYYNIIYNLVDDVKAAMSGLLAPTLREHMLGNAEIREIFSVSKIGKVAGCLVTDGVVQKGANVRLIRDNVVIHEGKLSQLKRFKDDAKEVVAGQECGMSFESYQDMRVGDVIECYTIEEIRRSL